MPTGSNASPENLSVARKVTSEWGPRLAKPNTNGIAPWFPRPGSLTKDGWAIPRSFFARYGIPPMLTLSASDGSKVRGKEQWNPTSREKRARHGAPVLRQGTRAPVQFLLGSVSRLTPAGLTCYRLVICIGLSVPVSKSRKAVRFPQNLPSRSTWASGFRLLTRFFRHGPTINRNTCDQGNVPLRAR
jgi:hypothetical protein